MDFAQDLGPDALTVVNEEGGKQSLVPFALDACPFALARTWEEVERILAAGGLQHQMPECGPCAAIVIDIARVIYQCKADRVARSDDELPALAAQVVLMLPGGPAAGLLETGRVLYQGEQKYGAANWRRIPQREHLRHALAHLHAHMAGDRSEGEMGHLLRVICRLWFAFEVSGVERWT